MLSDTMHYSSAFAISVLQKLNPNNLQTVFQQWADGGDSPVAQLTMRSTKGFRMRASGGRAGNEEDDGELEMDAELAKERELARHDSGRHLERLGWGEGPLEGVAGGGRAWELARDMAVGRPKKEEVDTMLCMRLGTLALLPAVS